MKDKVATPAKLKTALMDLACSVSNNANAHDDDLLETWDYLKRDYESLKKLMDKYIEQGE